MAGRIEDRVGTDIEVRPLAPDDSPGLAACIERCYGDSYPKRVLYRAEQAAALIGAGDYCGGAATIGRKPALAFPSTGNPRFVISSVSNFTVWGCS